MKILLIALILLSSCAGMKQMGTLNKPDSHFEQVRCPEYPQYFHYVRKDQMKRNPDQCPKRIIKKSNLP